VRSASAVTIDGDRLRIPADALDLSGFRAWVTSEKFPEHVRASYIAGEVMLEIAPEATESHNKVKGEVTAAVIQIVRDGDLGEVYCDGTLYTHPGAGVSTEPDLLVVTWPTLERKRVSFTPKAGRPGDYVELEGTPDMVVEVVSDASVKKDLELLREGYRRAGIPEYWVIDARGDGIHFEILHLEKRRYRPSAVTPAAQRSRVLGGVFRLRRARNRVGRWSYRLEFRPD
jgi:Uma2 family endonuclease